MKRFFRSFSRSPGRPNRKASIQNQKPADLPCPSSSESLDDEQEGGTSEQSLSHKQILPKPTESQNFNICLTKSGNLVLKSYLVDAFGDRIGENHCHIFVISTRGMVLYEEKIGQRVYPDLESMVGQTEAKRLEGEIESTKRALNLAFKKKSRGDARLERQGHVLATLELELQQVMKDITHTSRHLHILSETRDKTKAELSTLLQHEMSKLEFILRKDEPDLLTQYDGLQTTAEITKFKKNLQKTICNYEKILALAKHKYDTVKAGEKQAEKKTCTLVLKPRRKVKKKKLRSDAPSARTRREELVASLIQVSDARRRGDIRQLLETEL